MARSHEEVVGDEVEGGEAGKRTRTGNKPKGEEGAEFDQDGKAKTVTISLFFLYIARLVTCSLAGLTSHHPSRMPYA